MVLPVTNFKAKLISIPKVPKKEGSDEMIEYGKFTLNKKYRVYSVYSDRDFTDFLVVDDMGLFLWISMAVFKK